MPKNAIFQGCFTEVSFATYEGNQLPYSENGYFSKFFGNLITHITREYAGKKIKSFLNVSPLKIIDILLSVFTVSSLYLNPAA